jgi:hypothetical protein
MLVVSAVDQHKQDCLAHTRLMLHMSEGILCFSHVALQQGATCDGEIPRL